MEQIIVKQLPNPEPEKKGAGMKYIESNEYLTPKTGRDGKLITGFDETSIDVLSIEDGKERDELIKSIKKEKTELEKLLGVDLGYNSQYWKDFYFVLNDEITLDPDNPRDRVIERFLVANHYVAPSEEAIFNSDEYANCVFYLHRETEVITKKAVKQLKKDKATSKLYMLKEENVNTLKIVATFLLGFDTTDLSPEVVYGKLSDFVNDPNDGDKNVEAFLVAISKKPEELQTKIILDVAVRKKIITTRGNVYRRGETVFGNSYDEALQYLSEIEHSTDLSSIKKEVSK